MWSNANNFLRRWFCLDIFDLLLIYLFMDFCFSFLFVWLKDDLIFHFFRTSPITVQRQSNHKKLETFFFFGNRFNWAHNFDFPSQIINKVIFEDILAKGREGDLNSLEEVKSVSHTAIYSLTLRWQYRIDMENVNCNEKSPVWIVFLHETV